MLGRQVDNAQLKKTIEELEAKTASALADRRVIAETMEHKDKEIHELQAQVEKLNQDIRRKEKANQQLQFRLTKGGGA